MKLSEVKTAQDVLDLDLKPKTSSQLMALMTQERLGAIRAREEANSIPEMFGEWIPLYEPVYEPCAAEISSEADFRRYARPHMTVRVRPGNVALSHLEGTIKAISDESYAIEFENAVPEGHDLGGLCQEGKGLWMYANQLDLLVPEQRAIGGYALRAGVTAHEDQGHQVRFGETYDTYSEGTTGRLVKADEVHVEILIGGESGHVQEFTLDARLQHLLQVSTLGQEEPKDPEEEIRKATYLHFFPAARMETETADLILVTLRMGKDFTLVGKPSTGKSETRRDIMDMFCEHVGYRFEIEGCRVGCSPYSFYDAEYAKEMPPCPECRARFDHGFLKTGYFRAPDPSEVPVVVAKVGEGHGVETSEGNVAFGRDEIVGYFLPDVSDSALNQILRLLTCATIESGAKSPELERLIAALEGSAEGQNRTGYVPGRLPSTNGGIWGLDEADKLRIPAQDNTLEALNSNKVQPNELQYGYSSHQVLIATANTRERFGDPFRDRIAIIRMRHPRDVDTDYEITMSRLHGKQESPEAVALTDLWSLELRALPEVPMPVILERAVSAFYVKFRSEYRGDGLTEITGGQRSKFDALLAARAKLCIDQEMYADTPLYADEKYVAYGIKYAFSSRIAEGTEEEETKATQALGRYVDANLESKIAEERDTWFCRLYQHLSLLEMRRSGVWSMFNSEIEEYEQDQQRAWISYQRVKKASQKAASTSTQNTVYTMPFMAYLYDHQPGMANIKEEELVGTQDKPGLISYFLEQKEQAKPQPVEA